MSYVARSLPFTWAIQTEFLAPGYGLSQPHSSAVGIWESEPVNQRTLSLALCLLFKQNSTK